MRRNEYSLPRSFLGFLLSCYSCVASPSGEKWLSAVPDETPLTQIHFPGTHNSAALHEPFPGTAKCQNLTIEEQLKVGVRFFDLRCRHQNDRFHLHHGPIPQNLSFGSLQETLARFLTRNPKECLLVSIQETAKPGKNSRSFAETLLDYQAKEPKLWSPQNQLSKLKKNRGKVILIRRFPGKETLGIDATDWKCQGIHASAHFLIQDRFKLNGPKNKWSAMEALWKQAPRYPKLLPLNFASGYQTNQLGIPNIPAISTPINLQLKDKLTKLPSPPPAVIILDFVDSELAKTIYKMNF